MAKFYGKIGFADTKETSPGVWSDTPVERYYYGDVVRNLRKLDSTGGINDSPNISNEISIVADPYANEHFHAMRYIEYMGSLWKINNVTVEYPRLILNIGGLYNA